MIRQLQMNDLITRDKLWNLQREAYKIETSMINFDEIPPLMEKIADLNKTKETFYGCWEEDQLIGAVSIEMTDTFTMDICRLMVRPDYFRRGIGSSLLNHVFQFPQVHTYRVATGARNLPALKLYERTGFQVVCNEEIAHNVWLRHLEKRK